jgi:hypothetical protein
MQTYILTHYFEFFARIENMGGHVHPSLPFIDPQNCLMEFE